VFWEDKVDSRRFEATSEFGFDRALPATCPFPDPAWEDARVLWAKHDATMQQRWQGSWEAGDCSGRSRLGLVMPGAAAQGWQWSVLVGRGLSERFSSQKLSSSASAISVPAAWAHLKAHAKPLCWWQPMCPLTGRMEVLQ